MKACGLQKNVTVQSALLNGAVPVTLGISLTLYANKFMKQD